MSRSRAVRPEIPKPKVKPETQRRCDECRVAYPVSEIKPLRDEAGQIVAWLCEECL